MKSPFIILSFLLWTSVIYSQNIEQPYGAKFSDPEWVQMMYSPNLKSINFIKLEKLYTDYYKTHKFVKGNHTQYYKRFMKKYRLYVDSKGFIDFKLIEANKLATENYYKQISKRHSFKRRGTLKSGNILSAKWEEIGPWEYDHDATMLAKDGYAPGATHVRGVEQSESNPNIIYACTSTAGVWKSIDKGLNWKCMTLNIPCTWVTGIAIHPTNPNILYAGFSDKIMKTVDGGETWTESKTNVGYIDDILVVRNNPNIVLAGGDKGLFRSTDSGKTFTKIAEGKIYEFEQHPTKNNVIYAIQSIKQKQTLFLKSTDIGETFKAKIKGWPGAGKYINTEFESVKFDGTEYGVSEKNINLGDDATPDFTIEMKIKTKGWEGWPCLFGNKNWNDGRKKGFAIYGTPSGQIGFNIGDGSKRLDLHLTDARIDDGKWHNISITFDRDKWRLVWIDGICTGWNNYKGNYELSFNDVATNIKTAVLQDGTLNHNQKVEAEIAEIRIFNKEVSAPVIKDYFAEIANNSHPDYGNLIYHYKIDEKSGKIFKNSLSNKNDITFQGTPEWNNFSKWKIITTTFKALENNQRTEISVTPKNPNIVMAFASGEVNGGKGTVGIYKSTDEGETFTRVCCGDGDGGVASITNKNLVSYSANLDTNGGQYNWDLALAISPLDENKVIAGGVMVSHSEDGGKNWKCDNAWHWITPKKYVHADIQDIEYNKNATGTGTDLWVASDGGVYYSTDDGNTFESRMHGIQGTNFDTFSSSPIGDAMIGGAYHNGVLRHYNKVYKGGKNGHGGWFGANGGDRADGLISQANPQQFFIQDGFFEFNEDRTKPAKKFKYNKKVPIKDFSRGMAWVPNHYKEFYVAVGDKLWRTNNNGTKWELVQDFKGGHITCLKTSESNKDFISLVHYGSGARLKKSLDGGVTWIDVTPNDDGASKLFDVDETNHNNMWVIMQSWSNGRKIFRTTNGGSSWEDMTGETLKNQYILTIAYQQGSDEALYISTNHAVYYKDKSMSDFKLYNKGLPVSTPGMNWLCPNYTHQVVRMGSDRGAFQIKYPKHSNPIAKPSVDKVHLLCPRDVFKFRDLSYVSAKATRKWEFLGGNPATSTEQNPTVRYTKPGKYTVKLTVTDNGKTVSKELKDFITVSNECGADDIAGEALSLTKNGDVVITKRGFDFGTNDFSMSCWIKTTEKAGEASILSNKDWNSGKYKGWILVMLNGKIVFNMSDGNQRRDIGTIDTYNDGKWHYVSVSADRDGVLKVYVDGVEKGSGSINGVENINVGAVFMGTDNQKRYPFKGTIDEIKVWNKAQSQEFFREQRHLTANPMTDTDLVAYYQFNRKDGKIIDRAGVNNADYFNAKNTISDAPVGGGKSDRTSITTGGEYKFTKTGVTLTFANSGILPNGEIVASKINVAPNKYPTTTNKTMPKYWIINNYGENINFDSPISLKFSKEQINSDLNNNDFQLFRRNENSFIDWGTALATSEKVLTGTDGAILFSSGLGLTQSSQLTLTKKKSTLNIDNNIPFVPPFIFCICFLAGSCLSF